ncbi:hypothetical protein A8C75_09080 [Marinobacterium aestuarii]|uniref:Uncharacterized protein n=1 Tax=Marinobacterium aestuarii TaxID=1821621 RepID=A0A1A9EY03_9GAMM|nr:hypothetical protein [Marinobacterium aestuarii]ANG62620.1 hypothetical protein A8C75_09080 [Marinobacterium aestuarii]
MPEAENRKASLGAFVPSHNANSIKMFRDLSSDAFDWAVDPGEAAGLFQAIDKDPNALEYRVCRAFDAPASWFSFGHLSASSQHTSGRYIAEVVAQFSENSLDQLSIVLILFNAQFIVSQRGFHPATIGNDFHYVVAGTDETVGLRLFLTQTRDGSNDDTALFTELTDGLSIELTVPEGDDWQAIAPGALRSRIDVTTRWKRKGQEFPSDATGAIATIRAAATGGKHVAFKFWSPGVNVGFSGILHESYRFGLCPIDMDGYLTKVGLILGDHGTIGNAGSLTKTKREFGFGSDFRGVIFEGLGAHWLDDGLMGADITSSSSSGAVSFHEPPVRTSPTRFYASISAKIDPSNRESYLSFLKRGAKLKLTVAGNKLRLCSLSAEFKDIPNNGNPFGWLSGRKAVIALRSVGVGGAGSSEDYKLDITLDAAERGTLKTLTAADLGVDPTTFSYLASVLTLAPVFKLAGSKAQSNSSSKDSRVRLIEIATGDLTGALFAAEVLEDSWFFKNAVRADEFRVTGVRLLSQRTTGGRDTALLFDVETDFAVQSVELPLKSTKAMSVRIENTGLLQRSGKVHWVQAEQGALDLKILDASAWDFGNFGGLLAVKKIGFQLTDRPFLNMTLGLSLNLGVVTADDIKATLNLKSPTKDIQFYPSTFSINTPAVIGEGTLDLGPPGHATDEVAGSVDLKFLSGLRMSGAIQILKVEDDRTYTAFAAGARVEWPSPVPLASSGLAIKGLDAVYTTHLKRLENKVVGVPPALDWLQRAGGDVAITAVSNKALWIPDYDRWSFGAGALLVPNAANSLLSLNSFILVELPGPKILGFMKVNFLEDPKGNKEKAESGDKLNIGILGILEIDVNTKRIRAGASIHLTFANVLTLDGTTDTEWAMGSISRWHHYIGHFKRPNRIELTLSDFHSVGATGYLMVAGDEIKSIPAGSSGIRDLPGLALAIGATAMVKLGSGSLYLRMKMQLFLNLSLGTNIYAAGELELSGELYIFIGGISSSGRLGFQYYDDGNDIYVCLSGELCGHIRVGFARIGGCVSASIGAKVPNKIAIPPLINKISLVSGTNVALFGQGAISKIDSVIASFDANGAAKTLTEIPVDCVIAVSLECAPDLRGKKGFLGRLQAAADRTLFNYGDKTGGYILTDVTLSALESDGSHKPIKHGDADAVWWRNAQSPGDGHAIPMTLALLTRNPFGTPNAVASPETIERWIDALTSTTGICDTLGPQLSLNLFPQRSVSGKYIGSRCQWQLQGRFRSANIEQLLAGSPHETLAASVEQRPSYGRIEDPLHGFPRFAGAVRYEEPYQAPEPVSVLEICNFALKTDMPPTELFLSCAGMTPVPNSGGAIMTILLACSVTNALDFSELDVRCTDANGTDLAVEVNLDTSSTSAANFHEDSDTWRPAVESSMALVDVPGYGALQFAQLTIKLCDENLWDEMAPPVELIVQLRPRTASPDDRPPPVYIAACKYLSIEEYRRHIEQKKFNEGVVKELEAYLQPRPAPVLEPDREYQLQLTWSTRGAGVIQSRKTERYVFTTEANPPRTLAPYLLGTYPEHEARFHPPGQQFGFSLSSGDILKILTKFPGAALKISVAEDGNNPVSGNTGGQVVDWVAGRIYPPADLLNLKKNPVGLTRKHFRALPSALLRAIKTAIAKGQLGCIAKEISLDDGIWLGIEADLEPLRGYTVTLDIVDSTGVPWPYSPEAEKPFFRWHFRTGIHPDIRAHADAFARPAKHSRLLQPSAFANKQALLQALDSLAKPTRVSEEYRDSDLAGEAPPVVPDTLSIIEDQLLEDFLTRATGARSALDGETETLLVWGGKVEQPECVAVVLRSREPISRHTSSVHVRKETNGLNTAEVLHLEEVTTRYPIFEKSQAAERLFLSSSGTMIVIIPDRAQLEALGRLTVALKDHPPYYLPYADAEVVVDLIGIAATEFDR